MLSNRGGEEVVLVILSFQYIFQQNLVVKFGGKHLFKIRVRFHEKLHSLLKSKVTGVLSYTHPVLQLRK